MRHIAQQRWNSLSSRERIVVMGLGIVIATALLFTLVVDPLLDSIDLLDRQLAAKERALSQLAIVGADYTMARAQLAEFDQRIMAGKGTFSLLSYLEEAASAAQVREQITAMQPQASVSSHGYREVTAELRLGGVPLPSLLMLLAKLEDSPHLLQERRLHVKPRLDAPSRFDASLTVSTYDRE
jgi:general secretion pathway protein M